MEVKIISDYLKANMPLPQYLPYARFLLDINLSHTAKLLYTLLLDRATLSQKNNWVDSQGRIYVVYPLSHLAKDLGCCISSVTRSFSELEKAELAEQSALAAFPHPATSCSKFRILCRIAQSQYAPAHSHECAETHSMIAQKCTPNQRNKNNLKDNHLIKTNRCLFDSFGEYQNVFLTEKEYKQLKADFCRAGWSDRAACPLISSPPARKYADHAATLRIWAKRQQVREKDSTGYPGIHLCGRRKPIKTIEKILEQSVSSMPENAMDYYGAVGLLYCGKCQTPKEAFFAKGLVLMGKNKHPVECACHKAEREQQETAIKEQKHLDLVRRLKADGFSDSRDAGLDICKRQRALPTDAPCTPLCGAVADYAHREHRTAFLGRRWHRQEFPCRVHCERSDGSGSACAHDELCTHPERD